MSVDNEHDAPPAKAPKNDDGTFFYVVTMSSWGRSWSYLKRAKTLAEAKRQYGWTRMLHTTVRVHRATVSEVETIREEP